MSKKEELLSGSGSLVSKTLLGDRPIEEDMRDKMNALAHMIDEFYNGNARPKKWGFLMLSFRLGEIKGGRMNFISNCDRSDMCAAMREQVSYFEKEGKGVRRPATDLIERMAQKGMKTLADRKKTAAVMSLNPEDARAMMRAALDEVWR